ncbi:MAG TPA: flavoprotein, partial [Thermodesulfobacteriota bacterium]|nr:flavoprotein [Thermodesulfobacteriota bacterium]
MRLILGISGATGAIYGIRLLEVLKEKGIETHLIITSTSEKIIRDETSYSV